VCCKPLVGEIKKTKDCISAPAYSGPDFCSVTHGNIDKEYHNLKFFFVVYLDGVGCVACALSELINSEI
jgi:hypothetical protein